MSEVVVAPNDSSELVVAEEVVGRIETPVARLAYEGLMRLVQIGRLSKEDAIKHHHTFFPNHQNLAE